MHKTHCKTSRSIHPFGKRKSLYSQRLPFNAKVLGASHGFVHADRKPPIILTPDTYGEGFEETHRRNADPHLLKEQEFESACAPETKLLSRVGWGVTGVVGPSLIDDGKATITPPRG